jgi:hypothetical protein
MTLIEAYLYPEYASSFLVIPNMTALTIKWFADDSPPATHIIFANSFGSQAYSSDCLFIITI